ncbi:hypothetical protein PHLCEN_2v3224 [Hermanssonia centrifuga]|uniref:Uncharacterized protein n=1 Tax=Hermanssonia centrifuga TaxID=98765 RepID=A0A2R6QXL8_9APHY|nr:hypothetical protein PHLCEN_2v3224 [Hermanssonia centrifuga]
MALIESIPTMPASAADIPPELSEYRLDCLAPRDLKPDPGELSPERFFADTGEFPASQNVLQNDVARVWCPCQWFTPESA